MHASYAIHFWPESKPPSLRNQNERELEVPIYVSFLFFVFCLFFK